MISPDDIQIRVRTRDDFSLKLQAHMELNTAVVIANEALQSSYPVLEEISKAAKRDIMGQLYGDIYRKVTQIYMDCSRKLNFLSDGDSHRILTNLEELRHAVDPSRSDPIKKELEFVPSESGIWKNFLWVQLPDETTLGRIHNWNMGRWGFYPYNINFPLSETMLMEIAQALVTLNSKVSLKEPKL